MTQAYQMINILIMIVWTHCKETFKSVYPPVDFLLNVIEPKCSKNSVKEEIEREVVEFDHVYKI